MTAPSNPDPPQPAAGAKPPPVIPPEIVETPPDPAKLTTDEQMALYEKHLKENDWGHQPC
ncbi:MAG: hypothetical protein NTZ16_04375 [Verrucomicrobia bacterium]|nr:hypothetical protein [Verrucomicrobiota bacterium]